MVIDIDSFLDSINKEEIKENSQERQEKKKDISLDFQKDVEDKIYTTTKEFENKDFEALKLIYDEVKSFDADLPSKFSGIDTKSREVLEQLGDKYTKEYVKITKENAKELSSKINSNLQLLDTQLKEHEFSKALETFRYILKGYSYFPKVLLKERIELSTKIKNKEVEIYSYLATFREEKQKSIKKQLSENVSKLNHIMKNENDYSLKELEKAVVSLQMSIQNIHELMAVLLIKEKSIATKFLIHAENYLLKKYEEEFERRSNNINTLFEKFHESYIQKDLDSVLLIYNEILIEFKTLPDYFIEKKTNIYLEINKLFTSINKLIISVNMSRFVESYEYSKKIDSIKEYLFHLEKKQSVDIKNLLKLKSKINEFPKHFAGERDDIILKINSIIKNSMQYNEFIQKQNMQNTQGTQSTQSTSNPPNTQKSQIEQNDSNENSNKQEDLNLSSTINKNSNIKDIYKEIDNLYLALKQSQDSTEIKNLYKKIVFYINNSNMKPPVKSEVLRKVNKTLLSKKLK
jgi:hypothetical protein